MENRLDKANQRFNDLIAQNKKTREEIDNIRKEKAIFEGVYSKLEKQLASAQKVPSTEGRGRQMKNKRFYG